jgi:hypothetical protein
MSVDSARSGDHLVRIVPGFGSVEAERYVKRRDERLKAHDITPTIEACLAYDLGRADVLSAESLAASTNDNKEQE